MLTANIFTLNSGDPLCLPFPPLQLTQCHWTPQENCNMEFDENGEEIFENDHHLVTKRGTS